MSFTNSDWITVGGWFVTFVLGIIATLLTQWISKKKRTIGWSLMSESNLLSEAAVEEISHGFGVPVDITVKGRNVYDLSTIRVKVANIGNIELQEIVLHFHFGEFAEVYVGRYLTELGVYREALTLDKRANLATLTVQHINRGQSFEIEFLVGNYHAGDFTADMAKSGVTLREVSSLKLEKELRMLQFFGLSITGIKLDRTAMQTALLVDEVRALGKSITEYVGFMRKENRSHHDAVSDTSPQDRS